MHANAIEQNTIGSAMSQRNVLLALSVVVGAILLYMGFDAFAATGSLEAEFADMWTEIKGVAAGAPGKILMMLMVLGVIFFSTVKPNLVGFAGCVVSVLVLANAGNIIDNSLTATIFEAPASILPLLGR